MAILAALRWRPSRALYVAVVVIAIGAAVVALTPTTFGLNQGLNGASSGRGGLVSGGLRLFGDRPLQGWGSGSFVQEYRVHNRGAGQLSASHTIPITIAAEQGLIGADRVHRAGRLRARSCLVRGARGDPVRSAVAAAFGALVFHTMLYADFLEDPTTWALLGMGPLALAADGPAGAGQRSRRSAKRGAPPRQQASLSSACGPAPLIGGGNQSIEPSTVQQQEAVGVAQERAVVRDGDDRAGETVQCGVQHLGGVGVEVVGGLVEQQ